MSYSICVVPVAPIRKQPEHPAEMISQLLFGEYCTIVETTKNGFTKIIVKADGYEGWCQTQHLTPTDLKEVDTSNILLAADWVHALDYNGTLMQIPFGSSIIKAADMVKLSTASSYLFNGKAVATINLEPDTIIKLSTMFLNTPYLWGGRSVFGVDCSGFTQVVYKFFGKQLLRDANQQATQGTTVDFLQQAVCGDLAFFDNEVGEIIHVGMLLSPNKIIHAAAKVQTDDIDNGGIVSTQTGLRTHTLRIIKRYL
jgi:gamma-D-glutamyl-L-lysine dipeptidyl-peptidase